MFFTITIFYVSLYTFMHYQRRSKLSTKNQKTSQKVLLFAEEERQSVKRSRDFYKKIAASPKDLPRLVPMVGVEPTRYRYHGILSPARLPIPPHRLFKMLTYYILYVFFCQSIFIIFFAYFLLFYCNIVIISMQKILKRKNFQKNIFSKYRLNKRYFCDFTREIVTKFLKIVKNV